MRWYVVCINDIIYDIIYVGWLGLYEDLAIYKFMEKPMRKIIIVLIVLICLVLVPCYALAISFSFSGEGEETGFGSAKMNVSIAGSIVTISVDNITPTMWGDPAYTNTSGISGFGLFLDQVDNGSASEVPVPTVSSWVMLAKNSSGEIVTIGDSANLPDYVWRLEYEASNVLGIKFMDYFSTNSDSSGNGSGLLYNPDADTGFGADPLYFTAATLTLNLSSTIAFDDGSGAFVRMQNVGLDGEDSLKLFDYFENGDIPPLYVIPEPSTLILLGAGIIGLAVCRRKKN